MTLAQASEVVLVGESKDLILAGLVLIVFLLSAILAASLWR